MSEIFIADFAFGSYHIASAKVIKETTNQYKVDRRSVRMVHGWLYIPSTVNKSKGNTFATLLEAQAWCLKMLDAEASMLQESLVENRRLAEEIKASMGGQP